MRIRPQAIVMLPLLTLLSRSKNTLGFTPSTRNSVKAILSTQNVIATTNTRLSQSRLFAKQSQTKTQTYMDDSVSGYKAPAVNWYPGHIAKAERTLSETLTSADVLVEVRDARIPKATAHPKVREWTAGKPRIVVMTRVDMVPGTSIKSWSNALNDLGAGRWDGKVEDGNIRHQANQALKKRGIVGEDGQVEDVIYVDAKRGAGMPALLRAISRSGAYVNERRKSRGLRERPLRVAILGYPNVGKSALINRILGRKRARSANTPGVTRSLQWIRVKGDMDGTDETGKTRKTKSNKRINGDFELLDSPGIIPANMENQEDAVLLSICNSIGNAAYDNQGVAAYLCERLKTLYQMEVEGLTAPQWRQKCIERYDFDPLEPIVIPSLDNEERMRVPTGEDMLFKVAENTCYGDPENAARKILQDYRSGRMGPICLQIAPRDEDSISEGEKKVGVYREVSVLGESINTLSSRNSDETEEERLRRAENAMKAAQDRGLELPPIIEEGNEDDVGKGLFDGW